MAFADYHVHKTACKVNRICMLIHFPPVTSATINGRGSKKTLSMNMIISSLTFQDVETLTMKTRGAGFANRRAGENSRRNLGAGH